MYEPRLAVLSRKFKGRRARPLTTLLGASLKWAALGWATFTPLGTFCTPPRVIPRIFTYLKKALRYPKGKSRFWVNAQCAHLVTRKPLNVRMGKGKGAKVRRYSKGRGQAPVAAMSYGREGLQRRVRRFVSIRLGCPVVVAVPEAGCPEAPFWVRQWRTQAALLKDRARELKALLKLVRRPLTKLFFARLFRLAWRRPRLKWRLRWPLLPSRAGAGRGRRLRLGGGFRAAAALWAGLASAAGGVRRRRRVRLRPLPGLKRLVARVRRAQVALVRWRRAGSLLALPGAALKSFASALRAAPYLTATGAGRGLTPQPTALSEASALWDVQGIRLPRVASASASGWSRAPLPAARALGELQALAASLPSAALSYVGGRWRVDPLTGTPDQEIEEGGALAAALVYQKRGGRILTRAPVAPLLMGHVSLWPQGGPRCAPAPRSAPTAPPSRPCSVFTWPP